MLQRDFATGIAAAMKNLVAIGCQTQARVMHHETADYTFDHIVVIADFDITCVH